MCAYCRTFIPNYAFLEKPLRALTTGKGLRSCDKIERPFTQMVDEKTWIYEFSALANPWGQIKTNRIFFNKAWCSGSCGAGCTGFKGICGVFWFDSDGPTRGLHDFARTENITFINSPMAEVSHDFAWHAKCNGEKMHNFESCHTPPYRGGWGGTPLLSISVGTGVYTTSRPVGHTFRELWQCPLCGWVGVQRSTNRLE